MRTMTRPEHREGVGDHVLDRDRAPLALERGGHRVGRVLGLHHFDGVVDVRIKRLNLPEQNRQSVSGKPSAVNAR